MHRSLTALIALSLTSSAVAQPGDDQQVLGWWRATLSHVGESHDIWLHFSERDGQLMASFSNPMIAIDDLPLSKVAVQPRSVELGSIGWTLRRDGDALVGVIPDVWSRFTSSRPGSFAPDAATPRRSARARRRVRRARCGPKACVRRSSAASRSMRAHNRLIAATDFGGVAALRANDGGSRMVGRRRRRHSGDAAGRRRVAVRPDRQGAAQARPRDRPAAVGILARQGRKAPGADDPKSRGDHYSSSAIVAGDSVYAGSRDGCVYRFNAESGATVGRYCATDLITATPVVDGPTRLFRELRPVSLRRRARYRAHRVEARRARRGTARPRPCRPQYPCRQPFLRPGRARQGDRKALVEPLLLVFLGRFSAQRRRPDGLYRLIRQPAPVRLRRRIGKKAVGEPRARLVVGQARGRAGHGLRLRHGNDQSYAGARLGAFAAIDRDTGKLRWIIQSPKRENAAAYGFASAR